MASWCHDGCEPKRNNTGECSDGNNVTSFPCCRQRDPDDGDRARHPNGTEHARNLAEWRACLTHSSCCERNSTKGERAPSGFSQRERGGQGKPPHPCGRTTSRHCESRNTYVETEDHDGDEVTGSGEINHPQHRRCEPRSGKHDRTHDAGTRSRVAQQAIPNGNSEKRKRPPAPGGNRGSKTESGDDGAEKCSQSARINH